MHLRYNIYRANKTGTGHAAQFETRKTAKGWSTFLSLAKQIPGEDKRFDWNNKINVSLGLDDLGKIASIINRRVKSEEKIYHESPDKSNKMIKIGPSNNGGYGLSVSHKIGSNDPIRMSVMLSEADASNLSYLIEKSVLSQMVVEYNEK